jgi:hypothetical protein
MLFNALPVAILRGAQESAHLRMTAKQKPGWNLQPGFELRRVRSA